LTLAKDAGRRVTVVPGELITYTLAVGAQDGAVSDVALTDRLPPGTLFVAASGEHTRSGPDGIVFTWQLGDLTDGQLVTRTLTVRVPLDIADGTQISNVDYLATASDAAPVGGLPVHVRAQKPKQVWLPIARRS
jgi:uncharacterized repeat protein (TIGR01451 family)